MLAMQVQPLQTQTRVRQLTNCRREAASLTQEPPQDGQVARIAARIKAEGVFRGDQRLAARLDPIPLARDCRRDVNRHAADTVADGDAPVPGRVLDTHGAIGIHPEDLDDRRDVGRHSQVEGDLSRWAELEDPFLAVRGVGQIEREQERHARARHHVQVPVRLAAPEHALVAHGIAFEIELLRNYSGGFGWLRQEWAAVEGTAEVLEYRQTVFA